VQERLVEGLGPFITLLVEIFLFVEVYVRLFWVSSLAYPNLFGTKGYVVVVVVEVYVHFHFTACADSLHATLQEY
jgi:hypothetical protein